MNCYAVMCIDSKVNKQYVACVFKSKKHAKLFIDQSDKKPHESFTIEKTVFNNGPELD